MRGNQDFGGIDPLPGLDSPRFGYHVSTQTPLPPFGFSFALAFQRSKAELEGVAPSHAYSVWQGKNLAAVARGWASLQERRGPGLLPPRGPGRANRGGRLGVGAAGCREAHRGGLGRWGDFTPEGVKYNHRIHDREQNPQMVGLGGNSPPTTFQVGEYLGSRGN